MCSEQGKIKSSVCQFCTTGKCAKQKKSIGTITITEQEKDLLVRVLNETLFKVKDLVTAHKILDMLDLAFPIDKE